MEGVNLLSLFVVTHEYDSSVLRGKIRAELTIKDEEAPLQTVGDGLVWVSVSVYTSYNKHERLVALVDMTEKKQVDTAKSEFVALATHQLRTPIAAIRWNVELLTKSLKEIQTDAQARYLEKIQRNTFRMVSLINDFLSVSKLEMGTFASAPEVIDMSEFMTSILEEFPEKITEKQLVVTRQDTPKHLRITIDSRLLHICISNLVSNAVKYLSPQGTLLVSYTLRGTSLEIVVADNGIGIPVAEQNQLFSKFFRATNARSHLTEGAGLGLYVVKQSVDQLGGTIEFTSTEGEGTRFTIVLPVQTTP